MSDERLIRLENLRRLVADRGLTPQSLSDRLGSRYSYWRDLLAGQKSFGEKAARRIEEGLDLPRGWLDQMSAKDWEDAFEAGWRAAAHWANREDLIADIGSLPYLADRHIALKERHDDGV